MEYQYSLEKGSKKHICPNPLCKQKRFVRYVNNDTGEYLHPDVGKCDRAVKCAHHYTPKQYFKDKNIKPKKRNIIRQYEDKIVFEFNYSVELKESVKKLSGCKWNSKDKHWFIETDVITDNIKQFARENHFKIFEHKQAKPERAYIPVDVLKKNLSGYSHNVFIQNLLTRVKYPFEKSDIDKVISLYNLGTVKNGYRKGAITFPFIDIENKVRAIQVKQFDESNHTLGNADKLDKVILNGLKKENRAIPRWLTKYIEYGDKEGYYTCLFGEHLLNKKENKNKTIAIVEAPKTAVYCWLYLHEHPIAKDWIFLAAGALYYLTVEKCEVLKGRSVCLLPDAANNARAFEVWTNIANEVRSELQYTNIFVSDILERLASEPDKQKGKDIADYLIEMDWKQFRKPLKPDNTSANTDNSLAVKKNKPCDEKDFFSQNTEVLNDDNSVCFPVLENQKKETWSNQIDGLETYFSKAQLPKQIKLNQCTTISNVPLFLETHFATVKANNGNKTFLPHINRLQELKQVLTTNKKQN